MKTEEINANLFNEWLSVHVQSGLLPEIMQCYSEIEKYGLKTHILHTKLFETIDLSVLAVLITKIEEDRVFRFWHRKQMKKMGLAMTLYISYVKETLSAQDSTSQGNNMELNRIDEELTESSHLSSDISRDSTENVKDIYAKNTQSQKSSKQRIPLRDAIIIVLKDYHLLTADEIALIIIERGLYELSVNNGGRVVESTINVYCRKNRFAKPENYLFEYEEDDNGTKRYSLVEKNDEEQIKSEDPKGVSLNQDVTEGVTDLTEEIIEEADESEPEQVAIFENEESLDITYSTKEPNKETENLEPVDEEANEPEGSEGPLNSTSEFDENDCDAERTEESIASAKEFHERQEQNDQDSVATERNDSTETATDDNSSNQMESHDFESQETGFAPSKSMPVEGQYSAKPERTIREAIIEVLSEGEVSQTVFRIFRRILDSNLFVFSYKNPISIVSDSINRACRDSDYPHKEQTLLFGARYNLNGITEYFLLSRESELEIDYDNGEEETHDEFESFEEVETDLGLSEDNNESSQVDVVELLSTDFDSLTSVDTRPSQATSSSEKKRTICDAIVQVLSGSDLSLTVPQIYTRIVDEKLYKFGAKNPISVVYSELSRSCRDSGISRKSKRILFGILKKQKGKVEYYLLSRESELFPDNTKDKITEETLSEHSSESMKNETNPDDNNRNPNESSNVEKAESLPASIITHDNEALVYKYDSANTMTYTVPVRLEYYEKAVSGFDAWCDLYITLVSFLMMDHKTLFPLNQTIQLSSRGKITLVDKALKSVMVSPKQIPGTQAYIETKLSTKDILTKIRLLLEYCNIDLEKVVITYAVKDNKETVPHVVDSTIEKSESDAFIEEFKKWLTSQNDITHSVCSGYITAIKAAEKYAKQLGCHSQVLFSYAFSEVKATVDELFSANEFIIQNKKLHNLYGKAISYLMLFIDSKNPEVRLRRSVSSEKAGSEEEKPCRPHNPYAKKRAKTPEEKLYKRIYREINRYKYIGDIAINDDEYEILIQYIRGLVSDFSNLKIRKDDPILSVALVQIGIREYNGRYWPHVSRISGVKLDGIKQGIIGRIFYNTLIVHEKYHLDKKELVNNILMHCFVTKHYADDFFEFLFAYYQYDLDRDLSQHTKEMRDYLMASMKKAEESSRAFRIKKGTADAATANEFGCKIRVRNILKWIDTYMFEDVLPDKSPNRTAQFFCEWALKSKRFRFEKNSISGRGRNRKIHFRTPYLHFNIKKEQFYIVLPVQTVPLSNEENSATLSWIIKYQENESTIISDTESTVIGCRTVEKEYIPIDQNDIFAEFRIELVKNDNIIVRSFLIKSDSARFFDDEFDYFARNRLYEGTVYAFTVRNNELICDCDYQVEPYLGLDFYTFQLVNGNVVKKPDGNALFVGKDLKEGLLDHHVVPMAHAYIDQSIDVIYSKAPAILIKAKESALKGILVVVNDQKFRFDEENFILFKSEVDNDFYCLMRTEAYCKGNGRYHILIDIPSERRTREYDFAIINGINFFFNRDIFIFEKEGVITIDGVHSVVPKSPVELEEKSFRFKISDIDRELIFVVDGIPVQIQVPIFQWKAAEHDEWRRNRPEELWHKELPDCFYFHVPGKTVSVYENQVQLDDDIQSMGLDHTNDQDVFVCDTRKIKSWLEIGSALHRIYVKVDNTAFEFLSVVTRCILTKCDLKADYTNSKIVIASKILGFSDCVADIFRNGVQIADKLTLTSNGAKLKTNRLYGNFEIVFYEYDDDDEFDFGEAVYSEFARKTITLKNKRSLIDKTVRIDYITKDKDENSFFAVDKYDIREWFVVRINRQDEIDPNIFYGTSRSINPELAGLQVQVELIDTKDSSKAMIFFYDEDEECYIDFLYDVHQKKLVTHESEHKNGRDNQFLEMTSSHYYHITTEK